MNDGRWVNINLLYICNTTLKAGEGISIFLGLFQKG